MFIRVVFRFVLPLVLLAMVGCSSSNGTSSRDTAAATKGEEDPGGSLQKGFSPGVLEAFLSSQGLELKGSAMEGSSGYAGYLAQYTGLKKTPGIPKYCLILTGTPYSMGYQAARLRPDATYAMLTTFMRVVGLAQLKQIGITIDPFSARGIQIYGLLGGILKNQCRANEHFIPEELRQEMQGLVDGMHEAGHTDVTYDDVMLLNQGIDTTYFMLLGLTGVTPYKLDKKLVVDTFLKILSIIGQPRDTYTVKNGNLLMKSQGVADAYPRAGCNEFVLGGDLTENGETIHGRDFMFDDAGVYQDAACMMVYLPEKGIPFVSVDPPGFVGHSVGLNARGLSIGMDVSQGAAYGENLGVGSMLVARHVLDTCSSLAQSVEAVKGLERGVPWIYVLADDEGDSDFGCGVELETGRTEDFTGPDTLPKWEQTLLAWCGYTSLLADQPLPGDGVLTRGAAWEYPRKFAKVNIRIPSPDPFFGSQDSTYAWFYFPDQVEDDPDVLVATNHFILPRMRFTEFQPLFWFMYRIEPLPESVWRYETLLGLIQENIDNGRKTGFFGSDPETPGEHTAGWMIDFLNAGRENSFFYGSAHENVEGHHTVMNNTTREVRALFGMMSDPWVGVNLDSFCSLFYNAKP